ncbi:MAG: GNAT family N-acetyltransferase [Solirubrobacteraceae bacterium]
MQALVRPARLDDRAAPRLLYLSAQPYYDAFAGSPERARRTLERLWSRGGHTASHESCHVAELAGTVAGVLVAFPAEDGDALARRFLALSVVRLPAWHWPAVLRHLRAAAEIIPEPPARSLYVDALAVDEGARRRGVATALLREAERLARQADLRGVSLDTGLHNHGARALYEASGFEVQGERPAPSARVAQAIGGPGFISFFKPV